MRVDICWWWAHDAGTTRRKANEMRKYNIGDHVIARKTVGGKSPQSQPWHEGVIIGSNRRLVWGYVRRFDVRLTTGHEAGSVLSVDRRNLQPYRDEVNWSRIA